MFSYCLHPPYSFLGCYYSWKLFLIAENEKHKHLESPKGESWECSRVHVVRLQISLLHVNIHIIRNWNGAWILFSSRICDRILGILLFQNLEYWERLLSQKLKGYRLYHICKLTSKAAQRRQWHPTPVLLPGKSHGRGSLVGRSPWGRWESDTTERLHSHLSLSCIGEGNGNPLQCFCLKNPRDGGAWWAAVYGVTESNTTNSRNSSKAAMYGFIYKER